MGLTSLRASAGKKDKSKNFKHKIEKKIAFSAKVKETYNSLAVKKGISKKKRVRRHQKKVKAYNLSDIKECLPDLDAQQPQISTDFKLNCKSRLKIVQRESVLLRAVLSHPAFQVDPISTIHEHLERTQPPPVVVVQDKRKGTKRNKKGKRKTTKGLSSSGPQSMEV